ncbi:MAG: hypothetical protein V3S69_03125 [Dehalococcoidales bacterium]
MNTIHEILCDAFAEIADKYGVIVKEVQTEWVDTSTTARIGYHLSRVDIEAIVIKTRHKDESPS